MPKLQGFISYTHEDAAMCKSLRDHLAVADTSDHIEFWTDKAISAGRYWNDEIEKAIQNAKVFLMLISARFDASTYIRDKERPAIEKRVKYCNGLIVPVVLYPCVLPKGLSDRQAVPITDKGHLRPIAKWRLRDEGFTAAHIQLRNALDTWCRKWRP